MYAPFLPYHHISRLALHLASLSGRYPMPSLLWFVATPLMVSGHVCTMWAHRLALNMFQEIIVHFVKIYIYLDFSQRLARHPHDEYKKMKNTNNKKHTYM